MTYQNVPVIMLHSVGVSNPQWSWNYLTCPYQCFEAQLRVIKRKGYSTISLKQLEGYMLYGEEIPKKSIAITFDDGYADIWIYAYPLLKKHGMCATVFINPDFVDPRDDLNAQHGSDAFLNPSGFLSWPEIQKMDRDGVVYSESHALTHTWYPISPKIIDFRHPDDSYLWMTWNEFPEKKHTLQFDNPKLKKLGEPVYAHEKSLLSPRYFPNPLIRTHLIDYVQKQGGTDFFSNPNWRNLLFEEVAKLQSSNHSQGTVETTQAYHDRITHELSSSKEILEAKLGREISFLCWPGGSATSIGMEIAQNTGYRLFNTARDMSPLARKHTKNQAFGGNRVQRFTPVTFFNGKENSNSKIVYAGTFWMMIYLWRMKDTTFSKLVFKALKSIAHLYYTLSR